MDEKGIIYLLQPAELVGTNRYKIGCSGKADLSRVRSYKTGTRYIHVMECDKPFHIESIIKIRFQQKFKLIAGQEYFEGDELEMKRVFFNIVTHKENNNKIKKIRTPKIKIRPKIKIKIKIKIIPKIKVKSSIQMKTEKDNIEHYEEQYNDTDSWSGNQNICTYACEYCNTVYSNKRNYKNHLLTPKHIKNTKGNQNFEKSLQFFCNHCIITCKNKRDFERHLLTSKHIKNEKPEEHAKKHYNFECQNCKKEYKNRSGLWKHLQSCKLENKQLCNQEEEDHEEKIKTFIEKKGDKQSFSELFTPELFLLLMEQNKELQTMLYENGNKCKNTV